VRQQDKIIVWSAYFDVAKTRNNGRRLPRNLAVSVPKTSEIKEAAEKVGYDCEIVSDSGYSKTPWLKPGMLLMKKKEPKDQMLKKIAKQLQKNRSTQPQQNKA
jgi:signal recognition particle subunit SRP19